MKVQRILAVAIIGALLAMLPLGSIGTVGCGTGKETPTLVTPTPIAITSATQQMESSKGSIAAFAENWSWSKSRSQDVKYGETKVSLDLGGKTPAIVAGLKLPFKTWKELVDYLWRNGRKP